MAPLRSVAWRIAAGALVVVLSGGSVADPGRGVAGAQAESTPAASGEAIELAGAVERSGPLTVAALQQLPTETVEVGYESSDGPERHTFTGVRLSDVLDLVGLVVDPDERNPLLRRYLIVAAKDGYQVVVAGGEIEPNFGNRPLLLAWEQDGQPLTEADGPLRLVVPGDRHGGRYVYRVIRIEVRRIEASA